MADSSIMFPACISVMCVNLYLCISSVYVYQNGGGQQAESAKCPAKWPGWAGWPLPTKARAKRENGRQRLGLEQSQLLQLVTSLRWVGRHQTKRAMETGFENTLIF